MGDERASFERQKPVPLGTPTIDQRALTLDQRIALSAALSAVTTLRQVLYDESRTLPQLMDFLHRAGRLSLDMHSAVGMPVPYIIKRDEED